MSHIQKYMNLKNFLAEKVVPNFMIWAVAYIFIGKIVSLRYPQVSVDWTALLDINGLLVFAEGVIAAIIIAWIVGKGAELPWLLQKVRDEASSALVNFSSIAIVVGGASSNWSSVILGIFGFGVAWRIP